MIVMVLGCFFGAGLTSGKEIATYFSVFGKYSNLGVILATACLFGLMYLFFRLSTKTNTFDKFVNLYFGKAGVLINWLFAVCLFVLTSSMFAGSLVIAKTISINSFVFALVTGLCCYLVVVGNVGVIQKISLLLVPIMIIVMLFVCGVPHSLQLTLGEPTLSIISSTNYVFMNIVTLGLFILETGHSYSRKQALIISIVCSLLIGIILYVANNAIIFNHVENSSMPLLTLASTKGFGVWVVSAITIWIGLFTTVISCVFVLGNFVNNYVSNYKVTVVMIILLAMLCSNFGFDFIVGHVYWIIGFVGIFVVFKVLFDTLKERRKAKKALTRLNHVKTG